MADVKNIITLGIGANPGSLVWFLTSGLEIAASSRVDVESTTALAWNVTSASAESYTVASGGAETYTVASGSNSRA